MRPQPHVGYDPGKRPELYAEPASSPASAEYGAFERVDYFKLQDVVVWLEPRAVGERPAPPAVEIDVPDWITADPAPLRVTGVGGELRVRNTRDRPATVFSVSDGNEFNLRDIAPRAQARHQVTSAGLIELMCEGADLPLARVFVAPTPWVRLTHGDATLIFDKLPPGEWEAVCWHPRLPGSRRPVTLAADHQEWVELCVGVRDLPAVP